MVAGREFDQSFQPAPNLKYPFTWDGKDVYGQILQGPQPLTVRIGYVYDAVYTQDDGTPIGPAGYEITLWAEAHLSIGSFDAATAEGLGGWSLSVHHVYDPAGRILYLGDGTKRDATAFPSTVLTVGGNGSFCTQTNCGDGGPATQAPMNPAGMAAAPDGSVYVADYGGQRIRKIGPDGVVSTVAGTGASCPSSTSPCGDGGPAGQAQFYYPWGLALGPDGSIYVSDQFDHRIRRIAPSGIITTVAGTGTPGFGGDGGDAAKAQLSNPAGVAVSPDGTLLIADSGNSRVRRVGTNGIITTVAGTGFGCYDTTCGDGGKATQAPVSGPQDVAVAPDGSFYIADYGDYRVRKVDAQGVITTVAGNGTPCYSYATKSWPGCGDGGPGTQAELTRVSGLALGPGGTLYIGDSDANRVRRLGPDGIITTVAGNGTAGYSGDKGAAAAARFTAPRNLAVGPAGDLFISDNATRVREVVPALPGLSAGSTAIPSEDGNQVYVFDQAGRHTQTLDGLTESVRYQFGYDAAGYLTSVTDGDGNVTTIQRNGAEQPSAIVAPGGQKTALTLDANGNLASVSDPGGNTTSFTSSADGLMTTLTDPRGGIHSYAYDPLGRLTKDQDAAGDTTTLNRVDGTNGYTVTVTSGLGRVTTYAVSYDPSTDVQHYLKTDPGGGQTAVDVASDGTQTGAYPDGTHDTLVPAPDPRWGLQVRLVGSLTQTTAHGLQQTSTLTRSVTQSDPNNPQSLQTLTDTLVINGSRTFTTSYDAGTRTLTRTSPQGRINSFVLDPHGRVITSNLGSGMASMQLTYDSHGRLTHTAWGSQSLTYAYDAKNRLIDRTDGAGNAYQYAYDAADRLTAETLPSGKTYHYLYDGNGNLTQVTMPGGQSHNLAYSPIDQITAYTPPGGGSYALAYDGDTARTTTTLPGGRVETYSYDSAGRPTGLSYAEAADSIGYSDMSDRVTSLTHTLAGNATPQESLGFGYDSGLLTSATATGVAQGTYSYTYDSNYLLSSIGLTSGTDTSTTAISRDSDGLVTGYGPFSITRGGPGGAPSSVGDGTLSMAVGYDNLSRVSSRSQTVNATQVYQDQLTYDAAGRISQRVETVGGTSHTYGYTYDADGQLVTVTKDGTTVEHYAYDSNGNRTSQTLGGNPTQAASYDAQDRLQTLGSTVYSFDSDGYLAQRGADTFQYSAHEQLMKAVVGGQSVTYAYDGMGRRVARTDGAGTTQYLYGNPSQPFQVTAVRDPAGTLSIFYYDQSGYLYAMQRGNARYYVATDEVGTPRTVSDAGGTVVKAIGYDSFGNVTSDSNAAFALPIGFAGGLSDPRTGLAHFGYRDYDPASGRWTARDPGLYDGGQGNLYAYVGNNPVSLRDPFGLFCVGGSAYVVIGGGAQFCVTTQGVSVCGELGFGIGESAAVSPFGDLSGDFWGVQSEVSGGVGGVLTGGFDYSHNQLDHCNPDNLGLKGCLAVFCGDLYRYGSSSSVSIETPASRQGFREIGQESLQAKIADKLCANAKW